MVYEIAIWGQSPHQVPIIAEAAKPGCLESGSQTSLVCTPGVQVRTISDLVEVADDNERDLRTMASKADELPGGLAWEEVAAGV